MHNIQIDILNFAAYGNNEFQLGGSTYSYVEGSKNQLEAQNICKDDDMGELAFIESEDELRKVGYVKCLK